MDMNSDGERERESKKSSAVSTAARPSSSHPLQPQPSAQSEPEPGPGRSLSQSPSPRRRSSSRDRGVFSPRSKQLPQHHEHGSPVQSPVRAAKTVPFGSSSPRLIAADRNPRIPTPTPIPGQTQPSQGGKAPTVPVQAWSLTSLGDSFDITAVDNNPGNMRAPIPQHEAKRGGGGGKQKLTAQRWLDGCRLIDQSLKTAGVETLRVALERSSNNPNSPNSPNLERI